MKEHIDFLINELNSLNKDWTVHIEHMYKYDEGNDLVEYTSVIFGVMYNGEFNPGYINKETKEFKIFSDYQFDDNWFECYEGGYECNITDCITELYNKIIEILKKEE